MSATGKKDLDTLAKQAKALTGYLLEVEGFADSSGNAVLNEKLSLERSQAVVDYLTEYGGISPLHLLAPGRWARHSRWRPTKRRRDAQRTGASW